MDKGSYAVLWRRLHATAAFWAIITGGGVVAIWVLADSPFGIEPLWPGVGMVLLTIIITSLRYRPSAFFVKSLSEVELLMMHYSLNNDIIL